jgi:hypothetical protein
MHGTRFELKGLDDIDDPNKPQRRQSRIGLSRPMEILGYPKVPARFLLIAMTELEK